MVLSHHNQPDFGSPVPPETREALALAMIDDFDAKMNILDKAYQGVCPASGPRRSSRSTTAISTFRFIRKTPNKTLLRKNLQLSL
jgi:hypothetical protein